MATLTSEIRTFLRADASILALVGARVRPRKLEQDDALPAIRVVIVGGDSDENLSGASGIAHGRVQVDAYGATSEAADALAELIRARLQGHRGTLNTVFCHGASVEGDLRQTEEPIDDAGDHFRYITGRDFRVTYTQ